MGRRGWFAHVNGPHHLLEFSALVGRKADLFGVVEGRDSPERHPLDCLVLFVSIFLPLLHLSVIIFIQHWNVMHYHKFTPWKKKTFLKSHDLHTTSETGISLRPLFLLLSPIFCHKFPSIQKPTFLGAASLSIISQFIFGFRRKIP